LEINLWQKQKALLSAKPHIHQDPRKELVKDQDQELSIPLRLAMGLGKSTEDKANK
jgi:hypothetical protein